MTEFLKILKSMLAADYPHYQFIYQFIYISAPG